MTRIGPYILTFSIFCTAHAWAQGELLDAISARDYASIRKLISEDHDVNSTNENSVSMLELAADEGDLATVLLLLRDGADATDYDASGQSRCAVAIDAARHAATNPIADSINPTHDLIVRGENSEVIARLARGENIKQRETDRSWTLLHSAALGGNVDMLRLLLELGANPNVEDIGGQTPLHLVAAIHPPEMTRLLLDARADPNARVKGHGLTALHLATLAGNNDAVLHLLDHGADIDALDTRQWSVLHICALKGNLELTKLLIARGAAATAPEVRGMTPAMIATGTGYDQLAGIFATLNSER